MPDFGDAAAATRTPFGPGAPARRGETACCAVGAGVAFDHLGIQQLHIRRPAATPLAENLDPRTGLKDLDREAYFLMLLDLLKTKSVDEILGMAEVKRLTDRLRAEDQRFREALLKHSRLDRNVIVTDFRGVDAPAGNRFLIYTLFPDANVSARLFDNPDGQISTISVGHSIFDRTCQTNVGKLLGEYGGGGHRGVGTAQFPKAEAEAKFQEIIQRLKAAG